MFKDRQLAWLCGSLLIEEVMLCDPEGKEARGHCGVQNPRIGYRFAGGTGSRSDGENQGAYRAFKDTRKGFSLPQGSFEDGRTAQTIAQVLEGQRF